jgi:glutathione-regulated potassium-efflux system ancillary protein KefG
MKVLVLFAHPAMERSRVNVELLKTATGRTGVTVRDLYEEYPSLGIDVEREQELLIAHDVVVFQHPFYWYSTPAILKEWQDLVLEHNWAYGKEGHALDGKVTFNAVTAGGPAPAYVPGGFNKFTVRHLLSPYEATANLCGMKYLAPFVVFGALQLRSADIRLCAQNYGRLLDALVEDRLDLQRAATLDHLIPELDTLIRPGVELAGAR